ncbi:hypothetical protein D9619_000226 [Psilocybe cf. subviscida]|uniref:DnaJ homologue subfamily C member 28 conserved domain-containing protein n=1 Tax=Psilocybe cf. subviscida TaxID=2480587 RepID=A0A8H5F382_9AGAR|nr:hypothetical protein D9619_000226 [Psilocybe cf. subviscida]
MQPTCSRILTPKTSRVLRSCHLRYVHSTSVLQNQQQQQSASAKLFADAAKEEAEERVKATSRVSILEQQHENWDGDEKMEDTVLRMLVDKYKPLRTGTIQSADEKIKQHLPKISPTPAHATTSTSTPTSASPPPLRPVTILWGGPGSNASPAPAVNLQPSATGSWATEPLLPSSAEHQPWHTTFRVPSHDEQSIKIKVASLPPPVVQKAGRTAPLDDKARRLEREHKKRRQTAVRLTDARESTLDYRLGVKGGGVGGGAGGGGGGVRSSALSSSNVQKNETAQVNPLSLRGWNSLIEDKIERARKAGAFDNVKGRGKPLNTSRDEYNPFIAREEFLMNRIVQRNNAAPPWVEVQLELEQAVTTFRQILRQAWVRRAVRMLVSENRQDQLDRLTPADVQRYRDAEWVEKERGYHTKAVDELNALVRKYNGLAPYAVRRAYYVREAEIARLYDECASDIFRLVSEQKSRSYLESGGAGGNGGGGGRSSGGGKLGKVGGGMVVPSAFFEWLRLLFRRWPEVFREDDTVIVPGDIVAVRHGVKGRQEGLVIGSHIDYAGRQIIEVQLDGELYNAFYPTVTRVRRTISYTRPAIDRRRTIERRVYW